MTCEDRGQIERSCEYDGGIDSMELATCSEGYRWRKARGGGIEKQPRRNSEEGVGSKQIR
jgi:hypothetical protein